jgi:hypothetical protein
VDQRDESLDIGVSSSPPARFQQPNTARNRQSNLGQIELPDLSHINDMALPDLQDLSPRNHDLRKDVSNPNSQCGTPKFNNLNLSNMHSLENPGSSGQVPIRKGIANANTEKDAQRNRGNATRPITNRREHYA